MKLIYTLMGFGTLAFFSMICMFAFDVMSWNLRSRDAKDACEGIADLFRISGAASTIIAALLGMAAFWANIDRIVR